jgi:hypothetical protein
MTAAHELSSDSKCVDGAPSHTRRSTRKNQKRLEERQNWGGPKKFDTRINHGRNPCQVIQFPVDAIH